jgi:hypothetical protein
MQVNEYKLIEKCVENGAQFGLNRAFKYDDAPTDEDIVNEVVLAVMQELCEWFNFEDNQ